MGFETLDNVKQSRDLVRKAENVLGVKILVHVDRFHNGLSARLLELLVGDAILLIVSHDDL